MRYEIEKYASRKNARSVAVSNFLMTLGNAGSEQGEIINMYSDARSYKWNYPTQAAIMAGIKKAYGRK